MCNISYLKPGQIIPFEQLHNVVHNNPHGYGLVIKENKKLHLFKEFSEEGSDPEKIQKLLEKHKDVERYLHVRWQTQGDRSLDNTQPFEVFTSKSRQVMFMHNGTIPTNSVSYPQEHSQDMIDNGVTNTSSDSAKFAFGKLLPLLSRWHGAEGPGDILDPYFVDIINKFWPYGAGRGILISSDQSHLLLNQANWERIKFQGTEQEPILTSNNDYFNRLVRGPLYESRKKAEEEEKRKERESATAIWRGTGRGVNKIPLKEALKLTAPPFHNTYGLSKEFAELFKSGEAYNPEALELMAAMEITEVEKLMNDHKDDMIFLFMCLTSHLKDAYKKIEDLTDDKDKATKRIATLVSEMKPFIPYKGADNVSEIPSD